MQNAHLANTSTNEEGIMSSPTSNNQATALKGSKEAYKESEDGESAAYPESEGLPKNSKETGMELALMGNLYDLVNENLMDS